MRETILGQLASRLARKDISGTAQWVSSMKDDKASRRVMDNLLTNWVAKDAEQASEWVSALEQDDQKTYAMKQLTARWSLMDPGFHRRMAQSISVRKARSGGGRICNPHFRTGSGRCSRDGLNPSSTRVQKQSDAKSLKCMGSLGSKDGKEWRRTNGYLPEK